MLVLLWNDDLPKVIHLYLLGTSGNIQMNIKCSSSQIFIWQLINNYKIS